MSNDEEKRDFFEDRPTTSAQANAAQLPITLKPASEVTHKVVFVKVDTNSQECHYFLPKNGMTNKTIFHIPGTGARINFPHAEEAFCQQMAALFNAVVILIFPRKSVESPYPKPFNDVSVVIAKFLKNAAQNHGSISLQSGSDFKWKNKRVLEDESSSISNRAERLYINLDEIILSGFSSGGLIALQLCMNFMYHDFSTQQCQNKTPFSRLLLFAPTPGLKPDILKIISDDDFINPQFFETVMVNYLGYLDNRGLDRAMAPDVNMLTNSDEIFAGMPETTIVYGSDENLGASINDLIKKLRQANVCVKPVILEGANHGFPWQPLDNYTIYLKSNKSTAYRGRGIYLSYHDDGELCFDVIHSDTEIESLKQVINDEHHEEIKKYLESYENTKYEEDIQFKVKDKHNSVENESFRKVRGYILDFVFKACKSRFYNCLDEIKANFSLSLKTKVPRMNDLRFPRISQMHNFFELEIFKDFMKALSENQPALDCSFDRKFEEFNDLFEKTTQIKLSSLDDTSKTLFLKELMRSWSYQKNQLLCKKFDIILYFSFNQLNEALNGKSLTIETLIDSYPFEEITFKEKTFKKSHNQIFLKWHFRRALKYYCTHDFIKNKVLFLFDDIDHASKYENTLVSFLNNSIKHYVIAGNQLNLLKSFSGLETIELNQVLSNNPDILFAQSLRNRYSQDVSCYTVELLFGLRKSIKDCFVNLTIVNQRKHGKYGKNIFKNNGAYEVLNREHYLNWHETIQRERGESRLEITEIFDERKSEDVKSNRQRFPRKILVHGWAGIGKTTLLRKIAYAWATGVLWKDKFKFVLWIHLRNLNTGKSSEQRQLKKIIEIELCDRTGKYKLDLDRLIDLLHNEYRSNEVLFMFDGFDELNNDTESAKVIHEVLQNPNWYIILTSRPTVTINAEFDSNLEIVGFTDENIKVYIQNYFKDKAEVANKLLNFIRGNPNIHAIARIPLNLELICSELAEDIPNETFTTLTHLYETIEQKLWRRMKRKAISDKQNAKKNLRKVDAYLQRLAFNGMKLGHYMLTEQDVLNAGEKIFYKANRRSKPTFDDFKDEYLSDILLSQFLRSAESEEHKQRNYYFLHLTFQEYFAGKYLSELLLSEDKTDINEAIHFIMNYRYRHRFQHMFWFTVGILNVESNQCDKKDAENGNNALNLFFEVLFNDTGGKNHRSKILYLIGCLEEGQSLKKLDEKNHYNIWDAIISGIINRDSLVKRHYLENENQDSELWENFFMFCLPRLERYCAEPVYLRILILKIKNLYRNLIEQYCKSPLILMRLLATLFYYKSYIFETREELLNCIELLKKNIDDSDIKLFNFVNSFIEEISLWFSCSQNEFEVLKKMTQEAERRVEANSDFPCKINTVVPMFLKWHKNLQEGTSNKLIKEINQQIMNLIGDMIYLDKINESVDKTKYYFQQKKLALEIVDGLFLLAELYRSRNNVEWYLIWYGIANYYIESPYCLHYPTGYFSEILKFSKIKHSEFKAHFDDQFYKNAKCDKLLEVLTSASGKLIIDQRTFFVGYAFLKVYTLLDDKTKQKIPINYQELIELYHRIVLQSNIEYFIDYFALIFLFIKETENRFFQFKMIISDLKQEMYKKLNHDTLFAHFFHEVNSDKASQSNDVHEFLELYKNNLLLSNVDMTSLMMNYAFRMRAVLYFNINDIVPSRLNDDNETLSKKLIHPHFLNYFYQIKGFNKLWGFLQNQYSDESTYFFNAQKFSDVLKLISTGFCHRKNDTIYHELHHEATNDSIQKLTVHSNVMTYTKSIRYDLYKNSSTQITAKFQIEYTKRIIHLIQFLLEECENILGRAPCDFIIIVFGSMARLEKFSDSDIECGLILNDSSCKDESNRELIDSYFKKFLKLFESQLLLLGTTNENHKEYGLKIDTNVSPVVRAEKIIGFYGTPDQIFNKYSTIVKNIDGYNLFYILFNAKNIYPSTTIAKNLFKQYQDRCLETFTNMINSTQTQVELEPIPQSFSQEESINYGISAKKFFLRQFNSHCAYLKKHMQYIEKFSHNNRHSEKLHEYIIPRLKSHFTKPITLLVNDLVYLSFNPKLINQLFEFAADDSTDSMTLFLIQNLYSEGVISENLCSILKNSFEKAALMRILASPKSTEISSTHINTEMIFSDAVVDILESLIYLVFLPLSMIYEQILAQLKTSSIKEIMEKGFDPGIYFLKHLPFISKKYETAHALTDSILSYLTNPSIHTNLSEQNINLINTNEYFDATPYYFYREIANGQPFQLNRSEKIKSIEEIQHGWKIFNNKIRIPFPGRNVYLRYSLFKRADLEAIIEDLIKKRFWNTIDVKNSFAILDNNDIVNAQEVTFDSGNVYEENISFDDQKRICVFRKDKEDLFLERLLEGAEFFLEISNFSFFQSSIDMLLDSLSRSSIQYVHLDISQLKQENRIELFNRLESTTKEESVVVMVSEYEKNIKTMHHQIFNGNILEMMLQEELMLDCSIDINLNLLSNKDLLTLAKNELNAKVTFDNNYPFYCFLIQFKQCNSIRDVLLISAFLHHHTHAPTVLKIHAVCYKLELFEILVEIIKHTNNIFHCEMNNHVFLVDFLQNQKNLNNLLHLRHLKFFKNCIYKKIVSPQSLPDQYGNIEITFHPGLLDNLDSLIKFLIKHSSKMNRVKLNFTDLLNYPCWTIAINYENDNYQLNERGIYLYRRDIDVFAIFIHNRWKKDQPFNLSEYLRKKNKMSLIDKLLWDDSTYKKTNFQPSDTLLKILLLECNSHTTLSKKQINGLIKLANILPVEVVFPAIYHDTSDLAIKKLIISSENLNKSIQSLPSYLDEGHNSYKYNVIPGVDTAPVINIMQTLFNLPSSAFFVFILNFIKRWDKISMPFSPDFPSEPFVENEEVRRNTYHCDILDIVDNHDLDNMKKQRKRTKKIKHHHKGKSQYQMNKKEKTKKARYGELLLVRENKNFNDDEILIFNNSHKPTDDLCQGAIQSDLHKTNSEKRIYNSKRKTIKTKNGWIFPKKVSSLKKTLIIDKKTLNPITSTGRFDVLSSTVEIPFHQTETSKFFKSIINLQSDQVDGYVKGLISHMPFFDFNFFMEEMIKTLELLENKSSPRFLDVLFILGQNDLLGEKTINVLSDLLNSNNSNLCLYAANVLTRLGKSSISKNTILILLSEKLKNNTNNQKINLTIINIFIDLDELQQIYEEVLTFLLNQAKDYNKRYHAEQVKILARLGNYEFIRTKVVSKLLYMLQSMNRRSHAFVSDGLLILSKTQQGFLEILGKILPDLKNDFNCFYRLNFLVKLTTYHPCCDKTINALIPQIKTADLNVSQNLKRIFIMAGKQKFVRDRISFVFSKMLMTMRADQLTLDFLFSLIVELNNMHGYSQELTFQFIELFRNSNLVWNKNFFYYVNQFCENDFFRENIVHLTVNLLNSKNMTLTLRGCNILLELCHNITILKDTMTELMRKSDFKHSFHYVVSNIFLKHKQNTIIQNSAIAIFLDLMQVHNISPADTFKILIKIGHDSTIKSKFVDALLDKLNSSKQNKYVVDCAVATLLKLDQSDTLIKLSCLIITQDIIFSTLLKMIKNETWFPRKKASSMIVELGSNELTQDRLLPIFAEHCKYQHNRDNEQFISILMKLIRSNLSQRKLFISIFKKLTYANSDDKGNIEFILIKSCEAVDAKAALLVVLLSELNDGQLKEYEIEHFINIMLKLDQEMILLNSNNFTSVQDKVISALINKLNDYYYCFTSDVVAFLVKLGCSETMQDKVLSALFKALDNDKWYFRERISAILSEFCHFDEISDKVISLLLTRLKDEKQNKYVRISIASILIESNKHREIHDYLTDFLLEVLKISYKKIYFESFSPRRYYSDLNFASPSIQKDMKIEYISNLLLRIGCTIKNQCEILKISEWQLHEFKNMSIRTKTWNYTPFILPPYPDQTSSSMPTFSNWRLNVAPEETPFAKTLPRIQKVVVIGRGLDSSIFFHIHWTDFSDPPISRTLSGISSHLQMIDRYLSELDRTERHINEAKTLLGSTRPQYNRFVEKKALPKACFFSKPVRPSSTKQKNRTRNLKEINNMRYQQDRTPRGGIFK